jgi:DNA-binding transcriptional LysR family regulator
VDTCCAANWVKPWGVHAFLPPLTLISDERIRCNLTLQSDKLVKTEQTDEQLCAMSKTSLAELEAVSAVARRGGFRAAARELGVSSSAVSHAIAQLEDHLGVRLFNRTTRNVVLTEAGERFVAEIAPALAAIDGALENIGEQSTAISGVLRINTYRAAAKVLLRPLFLEYMRRHPRVELEIVADEALVDILAHGFDAGIRLRDAVPLDMIAIPIIPEIRSVVIGAPAYFVGRNPPVVPTDLMRHQCIRGRMGTGKMYRWEFEKGGKTMLIDVPGPLTLNETSLVVEAALGGAGLAYIGEPWVAEHIAAGELKMVLEDWSPSYDGLSLYFAGRRHIPARLRALIALIREQTPNLTASISTA